MCNGTQGGISPNINSSPVFALGATSPGSAGGKKILIVNKDLATQEIVIPATGLVYIVDTVSMGGRGNAAGEVSAFFHSALNYIEGVS